jgi:tRNA(fMet)-specific endonuclease VapC
MKYLLDTNILIHLLRKTPHSQAIRNQIGFENSNNEFYISVVSQGEIQSISLQNNWGNNKLERLNLLFSQFIILDIKVQSIVDLYAQIDAFSQGKLPNVKSNFSARNMGKNDVWIAATAAYFDISLITTDKDFEHLNENFISLINP